MCSRCTNENHGDEARQGLRLRQVILALIRIPHVVWCHRAKHISSSALAAHDFDVTFGGSWRTVLTRLFCGANEQLVSRDAARLRNIFHRFAKCFSRQGDLFTFHNFFRRTALPPDRQRRKVRVMDTLLTSSQRPTRLKWSPSSHPCRCAWGGVGFEKGSEDGTNRKKRFDPCELRGRLSSSLDFAPFLWFDPCDLQFEDCQTTVGVAVCGEARQERLALSATGDGHRSRS